MSDGAGREGPLGADFFAQPTLEVARALVGSRLVCDWDGEARMVGRVVETEAYTQDDPAFHGWHLYDEERGMLKREGRGVELFGAPGTAYVYLSYGIHWLFNVVTEPEGVGGAVLIRAVEPLEGRKAMEERRPDRGGRSLTNGPAKLTQALGIDRTLHGTPVTAPPVYFLRGGLAEGQAMATSSRIGISRAVDRRGRFYVDGHPYVSPAPPSDERMAR